MITVFFIYGLAFFTLGTVIALYPKKGSSFAIARHLRLVAAFGLVHGTHEWLEMFGRIYGAGRFPPLDLISFITLPVSFSFLIFFGTTLIRSTKGESPLLKRLPFVLIAAWGLSAALSADMLRTGGILSRYMLAAPGILLTSYALMLQKNVFKKAGMPVVSTNFNIASGAFLLYALFAGLIVPEADFFPASLLNHAIFLRTTGLPVQAFRALCAIIIAYGMARVLGVFDWETRKAVIKARDDLEIRVEERTIELKETKDKIERALREKEVLLQEIHHRIKNNLQLISSLLSLQARHVKDDVYKEMFRESQNRISSMTFVHESIYKSKDLAGVDFGDYINKILSELIKTYGVSGRIRPSIDAEDIRLDINTAIPLGLIINELATNSIKHAFPGNRKGEIRVTAVRSGTGDIRLSVEDNGIGLPEGFDVSQTGTLGLHIVSTLVKQIKGGMELGKNAGTSFIIHYKEGLDDD